MKKKLGLGALIALVTGNMIGSAIFLLPSNLAQLGSLSLLSWVFTTLGTMCIALVFCRMSLMVPKTGGPYAYAQVGLGNILGFQTAYCYWIAIWVGNAATALAGVSYLAVFFPSLTQPLIACGASIFVIWVFTLINLRDMGSIGRAAILLTILKLIPILMIAIFGWAYFHPEFLSSAINVSTPPLSNFSVITTGATLTLWAFIGVESATVPSDSVENPQRNIPLATLIGTGIAVVVYLTSSTVLMGIIPNDILRVSTSPLADAAQIIFGTWGKWAVAAGAAISCFGCIHGWTLLQGQVPMAAANDGLFIKVFGRKNKYGVPSKGILITSVLVSIFLLLTISSDLVNQYKEIILLATVANLIPYLYTPVAEIVLYANKKTNMTRSAFFIAVMTILYSFWAIMGAGRDILALLVLLILSSVPLYLLASKKT